MVERGREEGDFFSLAVCQQIRFGDARVADKDCGKVFFESDTGGNGAILECDQDGSGGCVFQDIRHQVGGVRGSDAIEIGEFRRQERRLEHRNELARRHGWEDQEGRVWERAIERASASSAS